MKKILVLCTGNSCRSQMAEGYLRAFAGDRAEVHSAGIEAHGLNPRAVEVMREDGVDISNHKSKEIDKFDNVTFDYVITVCDNARERCPIFGGNARKLHHDFPDPAKATGTEEMILTAFVAVRNKIRTYCEEFVKSNLN
jgi:arsenate reductase